MSYLRQAKLQEIRALIAEGGVVGHIQHLYDNLELTFGEMKDIIQSAAEGRLEKASEKCDGMNVVFTWNVVENDLRVARASGDIKRGGMDSAALASKFFGRGNIEEAFNSAFTVLRDAMSTLPDKIKTKVFGPSGNKWYSVEIIYTVNPNVINYDSNNIVFHGWPVFEVQEDGTIEHADDSGVTILTSKVEQMQKAVSLKDWRVRGPSLLNLKKISDGSVAQNAINAIDEAASSAKISDSDTIFDYLHNLLLEEVADLALPPETAKMIVARVLGSPGAPGIPQIKKATPKEFHEAVVDFVKAGEGLKKKLIGPIEVAIQQFAIEVLRGLNSTLISKSDDEVMRLRAQVTKAIKAIESSGNQIAMDVLQKEMRGLGSVENITAAMEGVVFFYKGQAYKFTGGFSSANQILGLFKYGRKGVPPMNVEENKLSEILDRIHRQCRSRETLLNERDDLKKGEEFEKDEKAAKVAYDKAVANLKDWEENQKKKASFDAALNNLRKAGVGEERARKQLRTQAGLDYDPHFASQKRRETIENEIEKTKKEYGKFDPSVLGYARSVSGSRIKKDEPGKKQPPKDTKSLMKISDIAPLIWHPWPAKVKNNKGMSYGSKSAGSDVEIAAIGTGPGEEWLAYLLGAQIQGGGESYDLVTSDGKTWEVKQVLRAGDDIRCGTEALKAFDASQQRLNRIMNQIKNFVISAESIDLSDHLSDENVKQLAYINSFIDSEFEMIVSKGEISRERFIDIRSTLNILYKLKHTLNPFSDQKKIPTTISFNDKRIPVDKPTYVDVAKRVEKATNRQDILSDENAVDVVFSVLRDPAFNDPTTFFNEWFDGIDVNSVFSQVNGGLFIVNPSGFMKIPKSAINKVVKFKRVSQGKPKFALVVF